MGRGSSQRNTFGYHPEASLLHFLPTPPPNGCPHCQEGHQPPEGHSRGHRSATPPDSTVLRLHLGLPQLQQLQIPADEAPKHVHPCLGLWDPMALFRLLEEASLTLPPRTTLGTGTMAVSPTWKLFLHKMSSTDTTTHTIVPQKHIMAFKNLRLGHLVQHRN